MRLSLTKLFAAVVLSMICFAGVVQAQAPTMTKSERADMRRFAYNNSLFVLYHEVAHLLFDQLEMPVLGREEDAADNVATWILLNKRTKAAEVALADAAQGWLYSGVAYDSGGDEGDFAASHSLDKQRAYQIVCLMVGSDDSAFRPIANKYSMDRDRQETCFWDYDLVDRSLKSLLGVRNPPAIRGTEVKVTYHDAGGRLKAAADAFKSSGVFDQVAEEVRTQYTLDAKVAFNAQRCGEANAFYDPDTIEVIFCYELMQDYMDLYMDNMSKPAAPAPRETGPGPGKNKISKF